MVAEGPGARLSRVEGAVTPYLTRNRARLYVGDVLEVLRQMPSESVHCVVTSPPYWGLRDYGTPLKDSRCVSQ